MAQTPDHPITWSLIPRESRSPLPVCSWRFRQRGELRSRFGVPGHGKGSAMGLDLLDSGRAAEHHIGPGLGEDSGQRQCIHGSVQALRLSREQSQLRRKLRLLVAGRQTPIRQRLFDNHPQASRMGGSQRGSGAGFKQIPRCLDTIKEPRALWVGLDAHRPGQPAE